jgi:hypothetical protein
VPRSVFGCPWNELDLEHVEGFLAQAEDEGLLWEAKGGGQPPHRGSVVKAVCGFANSEGGFLILGADREGPYWRTTGVPLPNEPRVWLGSVIRSGLYPIPEHEALVWSVGGDRSVVVVRVEPVAVPPCLTTDGIAYQRVSGETVPVTDPRVLQALLERGRQAEERATDDAFEAVDNAREDCARAERAATLVLVALAATSYGRTTSIRSRLFTEPTAAVMQETVLKHLRPGRTPLAFRSVKVTPSQRSLIAAAVLREGRAWTVRAEETGAIAIVCSTPEDAIGFELLFEEIIEPAWRVGATLLEQLGALGETLAIVATSQGLGLFYNEGELDLPVHTITKLRTEEPEPRTTDIDFVRRDLLRAAGFPAWEPSEP